MYGCQMLEDEGSDAGAAVSPQSVGLGGTG